MREWYGCYYTFREVITINIYLQQVIEDSSPLQYVIEMLPELVESIYMMWVLSKGYRTDETMVPLLSRISWALCDKLERFLDLHKLFE
jgi:hypothetical protein